MRRAQGNSLPSTRAAEPAQDRGRRKRRARAPLEGRPAGSVVFGVTSLARVLPNLELPGTFGARSAAGPRPPRRGGPPGTRGCDLEPSRESWLEILESS